MPQASDHPPPRGRLVGGSLLLGLWLLLPPGPAFAQDATRLNERAVELYRAERYAEALEMFQEAFRRGPRAIQLYNSGRCQQRLGQFEAARTTFLTLLAREDLLTGEHVAYRDKARSALAEVEEVLAARQPQIGRAHV